MARKAFLLSSNTYGLRFAEDDAQILESALRQHDYHTIISKPDKLGVVKDFDQFIDSATRNDTLAFYYSGHGLVQYGELLLVLNTRPEKRANSIGISFFAEALANCVAHEKLIILDCCKASAGVWAGQWQPRQSTEYRILAASEQLEKAKEIEAFHASFMTHLICQALTCRSQEVADNKGAIKINALFTWLRDQTIAHNQRHQFDDVPVPSLLGNQKFDFTIGNTGRARPISEIPYAITRVAQSVPDLLRRNAEIQSTTAEQFDSLYNYNASLYEQMFGVFFERIRSIPELRKRQPTLLFYRIQAGDELSEIDQIALNAIRTDQRFLPRERSVVVNATILSILNSFSISRINLLIDFLSDFEEPVWKTALIGLVLSISAHRPRLNDHPDTATRIAEIQRNPKVRQGIAIITSLMARRAYDFTNLLPTITNIENFSYAIQYLSEIFPEVSLFQQKEANAAFVVGCLEDLRENDLNPLEIDFDDYPFFSEPVNWFMPFEYGSDAVDAAVIRSKDPALTRRIIESLCNSGIYDNIDKHSILLRLDQMSEEDVSYLENLGRIDLRKLLPKRGFSDPPELCLQYLQRLRELYRFVNLFPRGRFREVFRLHIELQQVDYIDLIAPDGQARILGDSFFLFANYRAAANEYAKVLEQEPENIAVWKLLGNCFYLNHEFESATSIYLYINQISELEPDYTFKLGRCYLMTGFYENAREHLLKSISLDRRIDTLAALAICYELLGQTSEAVRCYLECNKIDPTAQWSLRRVASVCLDHGDKVVAHQYIDDYLTSLDEGQLVDKLWQEKKLSVSAEIETTAKNVRTG